MLTLIPSDHEVRKHTVTKLHNKRMKTQMLTVELVNPSNTDDILHCFNGATIDAHRLSAQFKHKLVEDSAMETQSLTLLLKDLPETIDYQGVKNLELACNNIQLVKKGAKRMCFLSFDNTKDVTEAYEKLSTKDVFGKKISVKFVTSRDKSTEADTDLDRTKLHVTNLPFTCTKADIEKEFDMAQTIKFPTNPSGKSRG